MEYKSKTQLARVFSEGWVRKHGYCLACDSNSLTQTAANTRARDFVCQACSHPYELKSSASRFGNKIVDGAYETMMQRLASGGMASFFLLRYSASWLVTDLFILHRSLITKAVIQKRKPLSDNAVRRGWTGCNLLLHLIPPEGRIPLIIRGRLVDRQTSRTIFRATDHLWQQTPAARGWAGAVLNCLHRIPHSPFTLADIYPFEIELGRSYPNNQHIRAKIRQQLQRLRDAGLLFFEGRGYYHLLTNKGAVQDAWKY